MGPGIHLFGGAQFPGRLARPAEPRGNGVGDAGHVQHRMALEDLGEPVGEAAFQAFSRALAQFKGQARLVRGDAQRHQADVVGAFLGAPEERVKKGVCAFLGEDLIQKALIKGFRHEGLLGLCGLRWRHQRGAPARPPTSSSITRKSSRGKAPGEKRPVSSCGRRGRPSGLMPASRAR